METPYRHSTGAMSRMNRFELHYDQHTYRPNRPVHARLHQYTHLFSPSDFHTSPTFRHRMILPNRSPQKVMSHAELRDYAYQDEDTANPVSPSTKTSNSANQDSSRPPHLSRSISMPVMTPEYTASVRKANSSHHVSRKNSLVSNCTHSREGSVGSDLSITTDGTSGDSGSNCHRHHHRRGSVAIRFEEKKVVLGDGEDENEDMGLAGDAEEMKFNENVFTSV